MRPPFFRSWLWLRPFPTGNQIIFDLSVGVLTSVLMYFLVVRLPERSKRVRVRAGLVSAYESFKQECISVYLACFVNSYPAELPRELLDRNRFREFFKGPYSQDQTKWDAVANGLNDYRVKTLVVELEILMNEIHYTLSAVDVADPKAYAFFKHLSQILYRSKNWSANYDDIKSMLGFLWSVHTGWSPIEGYLQKDVVQDMIDAL